MAPEVGVASVVGVAPEGAWPLWWAWPLRGVASVVGVAPEGRGPEGAWPSVAPT